MVEVSNLPCGYLTKRGAEFFGWTDILILIRETGRFGQGAEVVEGIVKSKSKEPSKVYLLGFGLL